MQLVVDTSAIVAVLVREPRRKALVKATAGAELLAPPSVHWEIGNAFSALFRRRRLTLIDAGRAVQAYQQIPIRFSEIDLVEALELSSRLDIYAYDAYVIACAVKHRCALLSLDRGMLGAAERAGIETVEIRS